MYYVISRHGQAIALPPQDKIFGPETYFAKTLAWANKHRRAQHSLLLLWHWKSFGRLAGRSYSCLVADLRISCCPFEIVCVIFIHHVSHMCAHMSADKV